MAAMRRPPVIRIVNHDRAGMSVLHDFEVDGHQLPVSDYKMEGTAYGLTVVTVTLRGRVSVTTIDAPPPTEALTPWSQKP